MTRENTYRRVKKRKSNALAAIDNPGLPLRPWMKILALWIAEQPKKPKKKDLLLQARIIAKARLTGADINRLMVRPDFQAHVEELMGQVEVQARALFTSQMVPAVHTHFNSMQKLYNQGEYADVAKFTAPYIERAYPVKADRAEKQATVVINLGSSEFAKRYLEAPAPEDEIVIEASEVTVVSDTE